jgi:uncharacterized membrane protein HdeD (DUF308 family)
MVESLARYWWMVVLRGVAAVLFGVVALVWPDVSLFALVVVFGAYALVDGVFALFSAFGPAAEGRRFWVALQGVLGIVVGAITFIWPDVTALALLYLIAAWAVVTGVIQFVAAVRLRREIRGEWLMALGGVLSVVVGIVLVAWPASGALALVLLIGAYAVVFGVVLVVLGLRLRRLARPGSASSRQMPATA